MPAGLRLHGGENSRSEKSGDPGRRPRRQHPPAAGVYRGGVAVPRWPRTPRAQAKVSPVMSRLAYTAFWLVAASLAHLTPASAQPLAPVQRAPFTAPLSNK